MLVLIILDVNDLIASYPAELILELDKKNVEFLVILNKIDTLPKTINMN